MTKFIMIRKITLLFIIAIVFGSCKVREKNVYFQNIGDVNLATSGTYEPAIKPDDLLVIVVSAATPEAAAPFNLSSSQLSNSETVETGSTLRQEAYTTYLVDYNGEIQLPVLGKVKVGGLKKSEAVSKINTELSKYIINPETKIRIVNFKVSVSGEVNSPGPVQLRSERLTLPEALSAAGDLTINGRRQNILIIRDNGAQKTYNYVDITKADFINSDFYYLSQNDQIYVEPNSARLKNSTLVGANIGILFSTISLVITLITLATR
jgi:polysaccharide export outer membrane protein